MSIIMSILKLLAGLGVFLGGMNYMSEGLQKSAGKGMKQMFNKISDKRIVGYGIGASATAIVQSSSTTSVMIMGLVNAGIMKLEHAVSIIFGAKLGTTITGLIVAFSAFGETDFSLNICFAAFALVGIAMMMFSKKDRLDKIGHIVAGFGFIFVGLILMGEAMGTEEINTFFISLFEKLQNPLLLVLLSMCFTGIIQSSSAATGIFIIMMSAGTMTTYQSFYLVIGANIGTCITALLASIGATPNAKRVAVIHTMTSLVGGILYGIILLFCGKALGELFDSIVALPGWRVAIFNVVYNLSYTLLLLPFVSQFARLSRRIVKDKNTELKVTKFIDDRLLSTPTVAVIQVQKETVYMGQIAKENLERSVDAILKQDISLKDAIENTETQINVLNREIASYLIKVSSESLSVDDEKILGTLHHVINDMERIGDHAQNFIEIAQTMLDDNADFSEEALDELRNMADRVDEMFELSLVALENHDAEQLPDIANLENEIDNLKRVYGNHHIARLNAQKCTVEAGTYFYDIITELERVADHLTNIAFSIKSPTGQTEL